MTRQKIENKRIALKEKNTFYISLKAAFGIDQKSVHLDYFDFFTVEKQQKP